MNEQIRPVEVVNILKQHPVCGAANAAHLPTRTTRQPEPEPVSEDRWLESQLEEPERWDGMS
jgi:hypothetical protein